MSSGILKMKGEKQMETQVKKRNGAWCPLKLSKKERKGKDLTQCHQPQTLTNVLIWEPT